MAYHLDDYSAGGDSVGPVDFLVLEFPGTNFNGEIMRNLVDLIAADTIRIIDLVVVAKSKFGSVATMELQELHQDASDALAPLQATISELITRDDIAAVADKLDNDSTAAVMLYENVWAVKTMQAMLKANGRVLAHERIPHRVVAEAIEDVSSLRSTQLA